MLTAIANFHMTSLPPEEMQIHIQACHFDKMCSLLNENIYFFRNMHKNEGIKLKECIKINILQIRISNFTIPVNTLVLIIDPVTHYS